MPHFEFIQKKMTKYGGEWGGEFMIIYVVGGKLTLVETM